LETQAHALGLIFFLLHWDGKQVIHSFISKQNDMLS